MKQYKIIQFGKTKDQGLHKLQEDYEWRLKKFVPVQRVFWKGADKKTASDKVINYIAEHPVEHVFVLDERGTTYRSTKLADELTAIHEENDVITFIIGDAQGFDARVRKEANTISLSKMTFPHELALTMLLEQVYRIETIKKGRPYHKD